MVSDSVSFDNELRRYETLLLMADLTVHYHSLAELFGHLAQQLQAFAGFATTFFALHDPARNLMVRQTLGESSMRPPEPEEVPVDGSPSGWVWRNQQPLVIPDLTNNQGFLEFLRPLIQQGISCCCMLPLTTAHRRLGTLVLGSSRPGVFREKDVQLLQRVANLTALSIENALTRAALQIERERLQMLVEVNSALVSHQDPGQLFPAISEFIRGVIAHDYASIELYDEGARGLSNYAVALAKKNGSPVTGGITPLNQALAGQAFLERQIRIIGLAELLANHTPMAKTLLEHGIRVLCCIPLLTRKGPLGVMNLGSKDEKAFRPQDLTLLKQIAGQIATAVETTESYREIAQLKDRLWEERSYLQGEIRQQLGFEEIVGDSPALRRILEQAKTVATSNATVLILGETGTGKELIARAIHRMSTRKDGSFIKMNCAAIPTGLLESELFGYERGAFTGAISQKIGRLELADRGTLFLDEIGDIPLQLQPKLLRVLQDQEFERLGGTRTLRVNTRLVAATNRDVAQSVVDREFRSDLYYRLNVFPIRLPALRERKEDIALLVRYFVQKFSRRLSKEIEIIPSETMNALKAWDWPGNVRELENFLERSVILSEGKILNSPLAELQVLGSPGEFSGTLHSLQRNHIVRALRESGGIIAGIHGAAARLGLKRTTLQSRMQRMGIAREEYEN